MTREELLKKSKPILFNTEMVRAILNGRKTVARRVIKPQPISNLCYTFAGGSYRTWGYPSPPYHADDILYVRETWQYLYELDGNEQIVEGTGKYYYAATDTLLFNTYVDSTGVTHERVPWEPSIHMPKDAARIFLRVTDVRVERLQDITQEQICREGVETEYPFALNGEEKLYAFSQLWNSTIKKSDLGTYGWDANPWVWVIEFERIEV